MPDCFQPPIGTPIAAMLVITSLTLTEPASIRRATLLGPVLLAEDRGGEPVAGVVGEAHRLLGVAHLHHPDDGAEGLVAHHLHRVVDVDQHGRLEVVAGAVDLLAAGQRPGAVGEGVVDLVLDDRGLVRRGHRADVLFRLAAVGALAQARRPASVSLATNSS